MKIKINRKLICSFLAIIMLFSTMPLMLVSMAYGATIDHNVDIKAETGGTFNVVILGATPTSLTGATATSLTVSEGATVTSLAMPDIGYEFKGWYDENDDELSDPNNKTYEFTVSTSTSLVAKFALKSFTVTFKPVTGGTVSVSGSGPYLFGSTVTVVATPSTNYTFEGWYDSNGKITGAGASYPFTITDSIVLEAKFTYVPPGGTPSGGGTPSTPAPEPEEEEEEPPTAPVFPFDDVVETNWFYNDVHYMWEEKLMNGTGDTQFSPYTPLNRGMVVTVLYRMEGEPDVSDLENPFADVLEGKYYYEAVIWAADKGVVLGYDSTTYGPEDPVTREQFATILYRYQEKVGKMAAETAEAKEFTDSASISEYAKNFVAKLVKQGIITGNADNTFNPKGRTNRAEFAAMLHRYLVAPEATEEEVEETEPIEEPDETEPAEETEETTDAADTEAPKE